MVFKYLLTNHENGKKRYFPCHPLSERVFVIDGEFIPAMTEEQTEMDKVPLVIDPSITDKVNAGVELKPMGTPPTHDGLTAARVAKSFVDAFNAFGNRPSEPVAEPSAELFPAESSVEPLSSETSNN